MAIAVFILDLSLPLGVAGGVPYVALVLVGWWFPKRWTIVLLAAIGSVLTAVGYVLSPEGAIPWIVITNRGYAVFVIWIAAGAIWLARRNRAHILQSEASLRVALHQAEAANRTKSEFLANMSHELRTPLNAIIGFSEIMKYEMFGPVGNPKYHEYVQDINASGVFLLDIINDILDLSKIEAGAIELREKNIDVLQILQSCLSLTKERAVLEGVDIECDSASDLPGLYADERKLKQIMINLLTNAIKFTPTGGKVTIKIWSHPEEGYVFQVADTGIGIALDDIPVALAPFGQIDSKLNRKYEGIGLGLPLTKSLVELHGGSFVMKSEVDVGTTVTVRFPAARITSVVNTGK